MKFPLRMEITETFHGILELKENTEIIYPKEFTAKKKRERSEYW